MENQTVQTLKFELTLNQANIVLAGLAKLPYEASAEVIDVIRQQASSQIAPQTEQPVAPPQDEVVD
jgi:hypothetical protein